MKSYKDLDVYNLGLELFYLSHSCSLKLPKYEMYELGSQLRRSADSVPTNIVEGYGRKRYKADFIKFLTYSWSSCLETVFHIEKINRLYPDVMPNDLELINRYNELSSKIYNFIKYVEENWKT
ncbi:four helix bundle protein [Flavobacterium jejuense]|uniref:Four helix bundle protein n=1 Tax=Flavobacterium jejuense TaxID=1544455 RepID=A0ABX0IU88_9FLAO|nr:four helix bundle protein [Flavobacterium jejuense]NHN26098.1 four helix bundle protein [Flavobacterium jejuense]